MYLHLSYNVYKLIIMKSGGSPTGVRALVEVVKETPSIHLKSFVYSFVDLCTLTMTPYQTHPPLYYI